MMNTSPRQQRTAIATAWLILALIPILVMGWTVGRYGPVFDDWDLLRMAVDNDFISVDVTRPLAFLTPVLTYNLAGGSLPLMYAQIVLLHIIEAVLMFELLRRVFAVWVPQVALYFGFLGAAIYVFFPTDVTHHVIVMIHGRYMQITIMLMALIWFHVASSGQRRWVWGAVALLIFNLMTKEHALILYFLMPGFLLYSGHKPWKERRWWGIIVLWYALLLAYSVWRFLYIPSLNTGIQRQIFSRSPLDLALGLIATFYQMIGNIFVETTQEHIDLTAQGTGLGWLPIAALIFSVLMVSIMAVLTIRGRVNTVSVARKRGGWLLLASLAIFVAGVLPYLYFGIVVIDINRALSRNTQLMTFSATVLWMVLPFSASLLLRRVARMKIEGHKLEVVLVSIVAVILLTTALVRQIHVGAAYIEAWDEQRTYWHRIYDLPQDTTPSPNPYPLQGIPETLIFLDNFPEQRNNAHFTMFSWAFNAGNYIMADRYGLMLPYVDSMNDVFYADGVVSVYLIIESHTNNPSRTLEFPLENVRRMVYDPETRDVSYSTVPGTYFTGEAPPKMYTGPNAITAPIELTSIGQHILGEEIAPVVCRSSVIVTSENTAPADGDAVITVEGAPVDRRAVKRGESLGYNLLAPCGASLTLSFEPVDGESVTLNADAPFIPAADGTDSPPFTVVFER